MIVIYDTNIVLDVLLARQPFYQNSADSMAFAEKQIVQGYLAATTITTIFYIARKTVGIIGAQNAIIKLLSIFNIAPINKQLLEQALKINTSDFEDAVIMASAINIQANCIVTRDQSGFSSSSTPIYTPADYIKAMISLS